MHSNTPESIRLSEPYRKKIGKVTFQISSFGNPKGTETAKQLLVRLMENEVTENDIDTEMEAENT